MCATDLIFCQEVNLKCNLNIAMYIYIYFLHVSCDYVANTPLKPAKLKRNFTHISTHNARDTKTILIVF